MSSEDETGTLDDERERRDSSADFGGAGGEASGNGAPQTGDGNPRIFVGNLTQPSSKDAVYNLFIEFGGVARVDFKQNFAFVVFDEPDSATRAVEKYHEFEQSCGKVLKVEKAVDRGKKDRKKERDDRNAGLPQKTSRGPVVRLENRVVINGKNGEFPEGKSFLSFYLHGAILKMVE